MIDIMRCPVCDTEIIGNIIQVHLELKKINTYVRTAATSAICHMVLDMKVLILPVVIDRIG